jgi:antitoxin HicB
MTRPQSYTITLRPEPEGGFTVLVPAFPEIVTYGEDEAEAIAMAKDAIELSVEHRIAEGMAVPVPEDTRVKQVTVLVPA